MTKEKPELVCVLSVAEATLLTLNEKYAYLLQHKISVFKNYDRSENIFT